jgi:CRP/FNR family cyclic AMP-dependent transcriptional regulator
MLTSIDRLLFIRSVPIFKQLRDDFLVRLASVMDEVHFETNYTIITEGQEGRAMYIVVSGKVSVHLRGQELARLDKGTCFGEMSVFDAEPRSASVTTIEPSQCLVLTQQQLYDAVDETPGIAVNIIRLLSRRIRELNRDLNTKRHLHHRDPWVQTSGFGDAQMPPVQHPLRSDSAEEAKPDHASRRPGGTVVPSWESIFPLGHGTY